MDFLSLLKRVSNLKWSTNDPEPRTFDDVTATSKIAMQQAMVELWHTYPFAFKKTAVYHRLAVGEDKIEAPFGEVQEVALEDGTPLTCVAPECLHQAHLSGVPRLFSVVSDHRGDIVSVYPAPAQEMLVKITFLTGSMAKTKEGSPRFNLTESSDSVNIAHPIYRELFENCLILLTQCYLIQDAQDENFIPYWDAYHRAVRILTGYCLNPLTKRIVI